MCTFAVCYYSYTTLLTWKMKLFYSKILLFGEYGIIKNSKGLAIPYNFYKGTLKKCESHKQCKPHQQSESHKQCEPHLQKEEEARKSNEALREFATYLQNLMEEENPIVRFNLEKLNADIAEGMYFDSSIPQGYGVGSSGALVAAIYSEYAIEPISAMENLTRKKLLQLKAIFLPRHFFGLRPTEQLPEFADTYQFTGPYRAYGHSLANA